MGKLGRSLGYALAVTAFATATATAAPAHAGWNTLPDGLEGTPQARWERFEHGDGRAWFDINQPGTAYEGRNNGWFHVGNGWAASRIRMDLSTGAISQHLFQCHASAWIHPLTPAGTQVGIEIWDPNGWQPLAKSYQWVAGGGYRGINTQSVDLRYRSRQLYVQVIYGNTNGTKTWVRFDDVSISCKNPYPV